MDSGAYGTFAESQVTCELGRKNALELWDKVSCEIRWQWDHILWAWMRPPRERLSDISIYGAGGGRKHSKGAGTVAVGRGSGENSV